MLGYHLGHGTTQATRPLMLLYRYNRADVMGNI
jgi:hypothetical protein